MSVLFIVVPLALLVVLIAVIGYVWSARSGQFDDLDTPAMRMLHDDDGTVPKEGLRRCEKISDVSMCETSGRVENADKANSRK